MDNNQLLEFIRQAVNEVPQVRRHLSIKADVVITSEEYKKEIIALVILLYYRRIADTDFMPRMNALIDKYMLDAYMTAWEKNGAGGAMPQNMTEAYTNAAATQKGFVNKYYEDILQARESGESIDALLSRAELWGTRYGQESNNAVAIIAATLLIIGASAVTQNIMDEIGATPAGGTVISLDSVNMVWREGDTDDKCGVCVALDGIIAPADLWRELRVTPQAAPNDKLDCGGWRCQCTLEITTLPVTPNARDRILSAVL